MHSCKGRFIAVAVGVMAMALASRFKEKVVHVRLPPTSFIVYIGVTGDGYDRSRARLSRARETERERELA